MKVLFNEFFMLGPIDSWSGIVWVGFLKIGRVNYDPAVYGYLDQLALVYIEGVPSVLTVVNARQGHKFRPQSTR